MENFQSKHMLVTGGAGFIGSNFIHYMLANNPRIQIVNLDRLTYAGNLKNVENLPDVNRYQFVEGNICDPELIEQLLIDYQIDTIVHFAAESHVDRSIAGPSEFIETNLVGTFNLLEQARLLWIEKNHWNENHCRFHHISTDEVYGSLKPTEPAFCETTAYQPNSPYSASKAGSDHLARAYFHTYGLPITTTSCSNNYGPYQHPEKLIPTIINACINKTEIPIYGDGENIRDWLYVIDHCHAIKTVLDEGKVGEKYNIGGNHEVTNIEIAKAICHDFDRRYPDNAPHDQLIRYVTDRPGHDRRYAVDISKVQKEFGWNPKTNFADGIHETINFYLQEFIEKPL